MRVNTTTSFPENWRTRTYSFFYFTRFKLELRMTKNVELRKKRKKKKSGRRLKTCRVSEASFKMRSYPKSDTRAGQFSPERYRRCTRRNVPYRKKKNIYIRMVNGPRSRHLEAEIAKGTTASEGRGSQNVYIRTILPCGDLERCNANCNDPEPALATGHLFQPSTALKKGMFSLGCSRKPTTES